MIILIIVKYFNDGQTKHAKFKFNKTCSFLVKPGRGVVNYGVISPKVMSSSTSNEGSNNNE